MVEGSGVLPETGRGGHAAAAQVWILLLCLAEEKVRRFPEFGSE